jgi:hypothetical protein
MLVASAVMSFACAVAALWPGVLDFNIAVRGGVAAFFVGRAALKMMLFVGSFRPRIADSNIIQGYHFLSYSYIVAGVLLGIGAAWHGSVIGYIVAYAAFSLAWVWFCINKSFASDGEKWSRSRRTRA